MSPLSSRESTPRQSSSSPSPPHTNPMQIYVKNVAGETTPLTISTDTTVSEIKTSLALSSSVVTDSVDPQTVRLIHAGRHLSTPTATFASLAIPEGSTLHVALPLPGGTVDALASGTSAAAAESASTPATPSKAKSAASRKPRCGFKACKEKVQPIVGDCGFCKRTFCAKHRMLESHSCEGLEDCKDEARERNREQLEKERTRPLQAL